MRNPSLVIIALSSLHFSQVPLAATPKEWRYNETPLYSSSRHRTQRAFTQGGPPCRH